MKRFCLAGDFTLSPLRVGRESRDERDHSSVGRRRNCSSNSRAAIDSPISLMLRKQRESSYVHKLRAGWRGSHTRFYLRRGTSTQVYKSSLSPWEKRLFRDDERKYALESMSKRSLNSFPRSKVTSEAIDSLRGCF